MGDQEEQTVRVRPPRAGPGSRGGVGAGHRPALRQEPRQESLSRPRSPLLSGICLAPQVSRWVVTLVGKVPGVGVWLSPATKGTCRVG